MPKVSVIMSAYNAQECIAEAIASILNQTFENFEFLILNDGSTDRTQEIIESFSDPRIQIIKQKNQGLTKSLNTLIKKARGTYIARMDADDVSLPERFEKQISFLETHPDIVMCGTQCDAYPVPCLHTDIKKMMIFHNPFVHSSVVIRSSVLKENLYNESFKYMQDYELWTRIVPFYKTANVPEVLLEYLIVDKGITKSKKKTIRYTIGRLCVRILFVARLIKSTFSKSAGK